jgi:hypothetical protein
VTSVSSSEGPSDVPAACVRVRFWPVAASLALGMSVALSSCAGSPARPLNQNFTKDEANRFVLSADGLPPGYAKVPAQTGHVPCDSGWMANQGALTETAGEAAVKQQLLALGAQGCHLAVYERTANGGTTGIRVLAVVFPTPQAASEALVLFRRSLSDPMLTESWAEDGETPPPASELPSPGLGQESTPGIKRVDARSGHSGSSNSTIDEFWRVRNVAVVLSAGHLFGATDDDVLRMARNMSDRAVRRR